MWALQRVLQDEKNWTEKAREIYNFRNAWSHEDKILFSDINDRNKVKVFYDWYDVVQRCCLIQGKDCNCFIFFIMLYWHYLFIFLFYFALEMHF